LHSFKPIYSRIAVLLMCGLLFGCVSGPETRKTEGTNPQTPRTPFTWGILSECKGCVIFKENKKTDVGFYIVVVTWKTQGELEVIESIDYDLQPTKWLESQENMDELQRVAVKGGLRYVKLMEDYTAEELEAARDICRKPIANK
jgi:hypothetical protein